jgi:DNA-binding transcriptional regulator WhiA
MEEKTNLQKLPSRVKYYLLEWKNSNMDEYLRKYGELRLNDLTLDQLHGLFSYATTKDGTELARLAS